MGIYYELNPTILAIITINNWYKCGITKETKMNMILEDNQKTIFEKIFGEKLFDKIYKKSDLIDLYTDSYNYICYKHFIVGTAALRIVSNGLHQRQSMLKWMRNKLLYSYNIDPFWTPTASQINMVILVKKSSPWHHENWAINLDTECVAWIDSNYINITNAKINSLQVFDPAHYGNFEQQIEAISKASIILTQWGGISFTNFLAPLGAVEIIITTWDDIQGYVNHNSLDEIPDYDMKVRDSLPLQTTLRYWDLSNSSRIKYIEREKLFKLIDAALEIVHATFN